MLHYSALGPMLCIQVHRIFHILLFHWYIICVYMYVHTCTCTCKFVFFLFFRLWMHSWAVWPSCMLPPGYSPLSTDPTLTLDNVTAIMKDVQEWKLVTTWIGVPPRKRYELESQSPTTDQAKQTCWDYWLHHHPVPSWRILAGGLYERQEHGALEVLQMNYLKGESIWAYQSLLGNWVLVCNSIACCLRLIIPCTCTRDKVISHVVVVIVVIVVIVSTKIAISQGLGTWVTSKYNESVAFGENGLQCASNRGA